MMKNTQKGYTLTEFLTLYVITVLALENDEMIRVDEAFGQETKSETGFKIMDIFIFIVFYPVFWVVHKIDIVDAEFANELFRVFNYFVWFLFAPIYLILIILYKIELKYKK